MKKPIRSIIVDDEVNGARTLQTLLKNYCPHVDVIAIAHDSDTATKLISDLKPDLVFLDIEMPEMNGFQLLEKFRTPTFDVIFVTAYGHFALQAFKTNAISYLLKPVDPEELIMAIEKYERQSGNNGIQNFLQLEKLLQDLNEQKNHPFRLPVFTSEGVTFLEIDKLVRLEADSNYTHIHTMNGKRITSAKTLKEYEEQLAGKFFFRIHNAHLVNLHHIEKYIKGDGGYVITSDGANLEVSRRRKQELLDALLHIR